MHCPICASVIDERTPRSSFVAPFNKTTYSLYACDQCGLQFWSPLKIIPDYYEAEGEFAYTLFHSGLRELPKWNQYFLERFSHPKFSGVSKPKLLDIGCGEGLLMKHAQSLGYEVYGFDLDAKSIDTARKTFGLERVYVSDLDQFVEKATREGLKFDVVTFFEVLEHQDDPLGFARKATSLLRPGGSLAGSVPNRDRLCAQLHRKNGHDIPPHHFLYLSHSVLRELFSRVGFTRVRCQPVTHTLLEFSGWLQATFLGGLSNAVRARFTHRLQSANVSTIGSQKAASAVQSYRLLKQIRDVVFLPIAILLLPLYFVHNRRGWGIYFEAHDLK